MDKDRRTTQRLKRAIDLLEDVVFEANTTWNADAGQLAIEISKRKILKIERFLKAVKK
jgi:hypothetical protein